MADGKKSGGNVSNGERPNVSKKTRNLTKAYNKKNPPIKNVIARFENKQRIINNPKGSKEISLRDKYIEEENVHQEATKYHELYEEVGVTWSACVQAAKTKFGEQLHHKWGPKLAALKEKKKNGVADSVDE